MDRAELIKELDELAEMTTPICLWDSPKTVEVGGGEVTVYCKPFEQFQSLVKQAADALREQEQSKAVQPFNEGATHNREQWISVKERLPSKDGRYLLYGRDTLAEKETFITEISKVYSDRGSVGWVVPWLEVTHWMPLPEPPKEGADHV